ncbi:MAG: endonuclease [Alphaproteobacteria bacterium]|nr:endonuclease [Alphaproteobacteria bacterium]
MSRLSMTVMSAPVAAIILSFAVPAMAEPPSRPVSSFTAAKKIARDNIYPGHQVTLYCGCKYVRNKTGTSGRISNLACGYEPRKNELRGKRLEWEHIVPASFFGRSRSCWTEGNPLCVNSKGEPYKGRRCCAKVDEAFKQMEADLHNLAPAVGELNGDRSDLPYGLKEGETREYGLCDFEIDRDERDVEPMDDVRGDVARVWFYMSNTYGLELNPEMRQQLQEWSVADPVDDWERVRDSRIEAVQGNGNPFLDQ